MRGAGRRLSRLDVRYSSGAHVIPDSSKYASLKGRIADRFRAYERRSEFWQNIPTFSLVLFYAGVFSLFSTVGLLAVATERVVPKIWVTLGFAVLCGVFAVSIAFAALNRKYVLIPAIVVADVVLSKWLGAVIRRGSTGPIAGGAESATQGLALAASLTVAAGYAFFLFFFNREGVRYFGAHTEIALARELHRSLVPEIDRRIGAFEIYGASVPSGEVGGDLVDVVERGDEWTAYVADVSGHGVSPGVLMAMFKATVHTLILNGCGGARLLDGIHQALYPLKTSNMFVTAGFLQERAGRLTLSLAGHPALLHFQRRTSQVCEYPAQDLPLGILAQQSFTAREIDCQPGDILLLLTDGISEVADRRGAELGAEPIKSGLQQWA